MKELIAHLVKQYGEYFKNIDDVDTFRQLVNRHEQNVDTTGGATSSDASLNGYVQPVSLHFPYLFHQWNGKILFNRLLPPAAARRTPNEGWSSSTMDDDEEAYFNTSDDDDNDRSNDVANRGHKDSPNNLGSSVRKITRSLVDYDDDEESTVPSGDDNISSKPMPDSPRRPPEKRARNDEDEGDEEDLLSRGGKQLMGTLGTRRLMLHGPKKLNIEPQPKKAKADD
ncbi:LOW QUALITY PROTEIN: hypothetical protein BC938DRAFT_474582 [Jimgerdemannia flammicorona]|uniref:Uncharacterized protein n=1 Tax=Jimgerdemannia flammicorona TaxID=994334 RepID=A0A433Q1X4_9FUNG|nr:LOW QUALITY PROTEIN: hypothetical protein BC938DRAFT_474582 [Jimgerdemannia flammicorona]